MKPPLRLSEWPLGLDPARPTRTIERLEWICPGFVQLARQAVARGRQASLGTKVVHTEPAALVERPGADYGPAWQHRAVTLVTEEGPVELRGPRLEVIDAEHPSNPKVLVRRARIADPLRRMVRRGEIEPRHRVAAEHLRDLHQASLSPHLPSGLRPRIGGSGTPNFTIDGTNELHCRRKVAQCMDTLGEDATAITFCVLSYGTIDGYAIAFGVRRIDASKALHRGLEAVAKFFGYLQNTPEIEKAANA